MPTLSRCTPALLRTVRGKPHAGEDDHEEQLSNTRPHRQLPTSLSSDSRRNSSTPPKRTVAGDEDIFADPLSSDDEDAAAFRRPQQLTPPPSQCKPDESGFKLPAPLDGPRSTASSPKFKVSGEHDPPTATGRPPVASEHAGSDSDDAVFNRTSSQQSKRMKLSESTSNLHALPRARNVHQYGKKTRRVLPEQQGSNPAATFKRIEQDKNAEEEGKNFKRIGLPPDMFGFGEGGSFKIPSEGKHGAALAQEDDDSSTLSSAAATPPAEEVADLDLPDVVAVERNIECTVCGGSVPYSAKEDFEEQNGLRTTTYNYRWHRRFCLFHRQMEGHALWQQKGYPQIDWGALPDRLSKPRHMRHVKGILDGGASAHREKWERRLRIEGGRPARQVAAAIADNTTQAGYYGPRGERIMSDHILNSFSDGLRALTAKDSLFAAAGVSSGVAGFVQNVLVPELALSLIGEDMGKKRGQAADVLAESAELGELLHPEGEDEREESSR